MLPCHSDENTLDLNRQRNHLESTLRDEKLALYNWQKWEAEYDGLKSALSETARRHDDTVEEEDGGDEGVHQHQAGTIRNDEDEDADEGRVMLAAALEYISVPLGSTDNGDGGDGESVLTPAEVDEIIYGSRRNNKTGSRSADDGGRKPRSLPQILSLLDRRIDYVRENELVLERRVEKAQRDLENFMDQDAVKEDGGGHHAVEKAGKSGEQDRASSPVTEIVEELDEAGNIVKGDTVRAGESAMELLDMLKRAGVKDVDGSGRVTEQGENEESKDEKNEAPKPATTTSAPPSIAAAGAVSDTTTSSTTPVSNVSTNGSTRRTIQEDEDGQDKTLNGIVTEVDEPPEDARLRREMLQYGLEEVGAVVAELEMDESASEFSVDDEEQKQYDWIMGDEEDEDEDEEEDEYGRTTSRVISDDYHRQMLELEKKLNARGLQNIGPDASSLPAEIREDLDRGGEASAAVTADAVRGSDAEKKSKPPKDKKKKKVAFAEDVDIAPDPSPTAPQVEAQKGEKPVESPEVAPIQEQIIERAQTERANGDVSESAKPAKKVSRFRSARQAQESTPAPTPASAPKTTPTDLSAQQHQQTNRSSPRDITLFPATPSEPKPFSQPIVYDDEPTSSDKNLASPSSPPKRQLLSDTLVERPPSGSTSSPAPDPDHIDEEMLKRQVKTEYYKLRNRQIQQEGGFVRKPEEDEEEHDEEQTYAPLDDQQQSGQKKVSRFKAARAKNNAFS